MLSRRALIAFGTTLVMGAMASRPAPAADETVLTLTGRIRAATGQPDARFTMDEIRDLGVTSFSTRTPWYPDSCSFEGVLMSRLMEAVRPTGDTARVSALNDYAADIPLNDFVAYRPILALRRNGEPMPISDKGPLFLIYPFDALPALQHQSFYSRSVWQVNRIEVL